MGVWNDNTRPLRLLPVLSLSSSASSFTACSYNAACGRLNEQYALISVLSGRSEITFLSVLRRRKMYGRTSSRNGPYDPPGRLARRFVKLENSFADPSKPGLTKSKIDHKSPSRFSTGVPVSATLAR